MAFKRTLLAVILAVVGLALDSSCDPVRCWECTSSVSWGDCAANATQSTCKANFNRCGKTKFEYGSQKLFVKGCRKADTCENACAKALETLGSKCSSKCCQGDLCNGDNVQNQKGEQLTCFECKSSISKEDCESKALVKTCTPGQDQCSESMAVNPSTKLFAKECATTKVCADGVNFCEQWQQGQSAKCYHRCCSEKLCNSVEASILKLNCFNCESKKSWEDCEKIKTHENCTYGKSRCITVSTLIETKHMSSENYRRACGPSADCENPDAICDVFKKSYGDDIKCKTNSKCCLEDFCNGYSSARLSVVSVFVLLSCAVMPFLQVLL